MAGLPQEVRVSSEHAAYRAAYERLAASRRFLDSPQFVSIETFTYCNAACDFCPYPDLPRKGDRMPTALFEKIIGELAASTQTWPLFMVLCRISEPFLDKRFFDFCHHIHRMMPRVKINHYSNASPLNDRMISKLVETKNAHWLRISLNDHRPDRYEQIMRIPFERTVANITRLHARKRAGEVGFPVVLSRVGTGQQDDVEFAEWCRANYPLFEVSVVPRFNWVGLDTGVRREMQSFGCNQWFRLHFLASGREAFCNIDDEGKYGSADANVTNALDIYNQPHRRALRESVAQRSTVAHCSTCVALA